MSFWAVELLPGKEHTFIPEFDLIVSQAVLPEAAKDKTRSVVSVKTNDNTFAIASLTLGSHDSQNLDILFDQGLELTLTNSGKNPVHLSGRYHEEDDDMEGMYGDEYGSEGEEGEGFSGSEEDDDDDDIDEEELTKQIQAQANKRNAAAANGAKGGAQQPAAKKQKGNEGAAVPVSPAQAKPAAAKQPQQPKQEQKQAKPAAQKSPAKAVKLQGGLSYEILQNGSGATATRGKQVSVRYVGRLPSGKVFDSSTKKPFKFKLGASEVIRGWDLGVEGMAVGEKRKLIIPPELAYGKRGAPPDIPPNATLHFDVEFLG
eukprot:TRINITY_DN116_c0_g1_i2.p1 TRINITY_DN116_c0_g1~~TRINITY_DN116_c0_g1_i2.p1  ORF type:complete len:316 (-),score=124.52 TRINITY_DN116_c0_g1_i2:64-1011(-)